MQEKSVKGDNIIPVQPCRKLDNRGSALTIQIPITHPMFNPHGTHQSHPINPYQHASVTFSSTPMPNRGRPLDSSVPSEQAMKSLSTTCGKGSAIPNSTPIGYNTSMNNRPIFIVPGTYPPFQINQGPSLRLPIVQSPESGLEAVRAIPLNFSKRKQTPLSRFRPNVVSGLSEPNDIQNFYTTATKYDPARRKQPARCDSLNINRPCQQHAIKATSSLKSLNSKADSGMQATNSYSLPSVQSGTALYSDFSRQTIMADRHINTTDCTPGVHHCLCNRNTSNTPFMFFGSPDPRQGQFEENSEEVILSSPESIPPPALDDWTAVDIMKENSKNLQMFQNSTSVEINSPKTVIDKSDDGSCPALGLSRQCSPQKNVNHKETSVEYKDKQTQFCSFAFPDDNTILSEDKLLCQQRKGKQRKRKRSTHCVNSALSEPITAETQTSLTQPTNQIQENNFHRGLDNNRIDNRCHYTLKAKATPLSIQTGDVHQANLIQPENLCLRDLCERSPPNLVSENNELQSQIELSIKETKYQIKTTTNQLENLLKLLAIPDASDSTDEFDAGLLTVLQAGCRLNSNLIYSLELFQSIQDVKHNNPLVSEKKCQSATFIPCLVQECPLDLTTVPTQHNENFATSQHNENFATSQHNENFASSQHNENLSTSQHNENLASSQHNENLATSQHNENLASSQHNGNLASSSNIMNEEHGDTSIVPSSNMEKVKNEHTHFLNTSGSAEICYPTDSKSSQSSPDRLYICELPISSETCEVMQFEPLLTSSTEGANTPITPKSVAIENNVTTQTQCSWNGSGKKKSSQDLSPIITEKSSLSQSISNLDTNSLIIEEIKNTTFDKLSISNDNTRDIEVDKETHDENQHSLNGCIGIQPETAVDREKGEEKCIQEPQLEILQQRTTHEPASTESSLKNALPSSIITKPFLNSNQAVCERLNINLYFKAKGSNTDEPSPNECEVRLSRSQTSHNPVNSPHDKLTTDVCSRSPKTLHDMADLNSMPPSEHKSKDGNRITKTPGKHVPNDGDVNIYGPMYSGLSPDKSSDSDSSIGSLLDKNTISTVKDSVNASAYNKTFTDASKGFTEGLNATREIATSPFENKSNSGWRKQTDKGQKSTGERINKSNSSEEKLQYKDMPYKKKESSSHEKHKKKERKEKSGNASQSTQKKDSDGNDTACKGTPDEDEENAPSTPSKRKRKTMALKRDTAVTRTCESVSDEIIRPTKVRGLKNQYRQACFKVFDRVYNFSWSEPFRDEIKRKQVPDYFQIVKRPMHLQLIACKLRQGHYRCIEEFVRDMRLIFSNCRLYHKPHPLQISPELLIAANNVEEFFDDQLRKVFPDLRGMAAS